MRDLTVCVMGGLVQCISRASSRLSSLRMRTATLMDSDMMEVAAAAAAAAAVEWERASRFTSPN